KRLIAIASVIVLLFAFTSCSGAQTDKTAPELQPPLDDTRKGELHELADTLSGYMSVGDETSALAMMDATMQKAMKGKVAATWDRIAKQSGAFIETGGYTGFQSDGYDIIELTVLFENGSYVQRTVFNAENLVAGLFFRAGAVETEPAETPGGVTEERVTVDAGSGYPLDGLLTLPESGANVALVLVHGSGPADKDETIGANKPFRDIAYALAGKGVAVLRYDKRTLTYGAKIAGDADAMEKLTVYDETIYDAVAAVKLLKNRFEKVYVLGHSMSGGLLAEINANGANCDGYIIMEGTPRKLYELSAEQNLLYADELEGNGKTDDAEQIRAFVRSELTKSSQLSELPDADALKAENAVFGMSAWYLRSFEGINTLDLHLKDGKPVLVLQGGRDRQVPENDFDLWKSGLSAHPDAVFKIYPTLNHIMGEYKGETVPFSELVTREYAQSTPVSADVTDDIFDWISNVK
ncbi:MAG: hypothetical protein LBS90_00825, partial [Oscillospiraceae bacterium]|nr:hypothetical protein [Oscillospiraceae bacterium]